MAFCIWKVGGGVLISWKGHTLSTLERKEISPYLNMFVEYETADGMRMK